ncbi:Alpha/Beta hydrolase protein [Calycina marina]|uniref:Alpha/Beta hydrolase protein n=1 Tax=Calycina marina TaxID=1763456 RepID=A0A9P7Z9X9_9HELO|nr:Alpha/Beta hydrolase protein [Calycina marina]
MISLPMARLTKLREGCWNLNGVKPSGLEEGEESKLPVLVSIYGDEWVQDATSDPRYNLSYTVEQSILTKKPVIEIFLDYRMTAFGFIYSKEVAASQNTNLGFRDQCGFFRAAIMESGNSVGTPLNGMDRYQKCLCQVPFARSPSLTYQGLQCFHIIDNLFVPWYSQQSIFQGRFARILILLMSDSNEGVGFGPSGVNNDSQAVNQLTHSKRWVANTAQIEEMLNLCSNISIMGSSYGWSNTIFPPKLELEYKQHTGIAGDLCMFALRRLLAQQISRYRENVYSYRWNAPNYNATSTIRIYNFSERPYVFGNTDPTTLIPLGNSAEDFQLSHLVSLPGIAQWPKYSAQPKDFVFRKNRSYVEDDTDIKGVKYVNFVAR